MKHALYIVLACVLVFAGTMPLRAAEKPAATVSAVKGAVVVHQTGRSAPTALRNGDSLFAGDEVETAANAAVNVTFADGSRVLMGAGGAMTLTEARFEGGRLTKNHFSVLRAAFEYHGGDKRARDVRVRMDCGTITARGTHFLHAMKDGACWVYVQDGAVDIASDGGRMSLAAGEGTRIGGAKAAPENAARWGDAELSWMVAALPGARIVIPAAEPVAPVAEPAPETVFEEPAVEEPVADMPVPKTQAEE